MSDHPFLYVNSRPWARRVSNIYQREGARAMDIAREDVARAVRSSPLQMVDLPQRIELECALAHSFGRYVQAGRQACRLAEALLLALDNTTLPSRVPDLSMLAVGSFYCELEPQCGMYVDVAADGHSVRVLLVRSPEQQGAWWQVADEVLSLSLALHDELALPEQAAIARWWVSLNRALKVLALLTQKRVQWLPDCRADAAGARRQYCLDWDQPLVANGIAAGGYWRRQGELAAGRLVWIPPR